MNDKIYYEGVYRTAPATPGLLKSVALQFVIVILLGSFAIPNSNEKQYFFLQKYYSKKLPRTYFLAR